MTQPIRLPPDLFRHRLPKLTEHSPHVDMITSASPVHACDHVHMRRVLCELREAVLEQVGKDQTDRLRHALSDAVKLSQRDPKCRRRVKPRPASPRPSSPRVPRSDTVIA